VTDEKGRKVAVQIDLKKYRELLEDIQDVLVSRSRRHEKRIPMDKVRAGLITANIIVGLMGLIGLLGRNLDRANWSKPRPIRGRRFHERQHP